MKPMQSQTRESMIGVQSQHEYGQLCQTLTLYVREQVQYPIYHQTVNGNVLYIYIYIYTYMQ